MKVFPASLWARLLLMALVIIVPALGVIGFDQAVERRQARERAVAETLRLTRLAAAQEASVFTGAERLLQTLAQFPGIRAADLGACNDLLPEVLRDHPGYHNLAVLNVEGVVLCASAPEIVSLSLADRPWFQRALRSPTTVLGEYQIGRVTGRPDIVVARPILNARERRVLSAAIALDQLEATASTSQLPPTATLTLVDRTRTIVARYPRGEPWIGKQVPEQIGVAQLAAGARETVVETAGVDGIRRLYVTVPVEAGFDTGLYLGMGVEPAAIFAESDAVLRRHVWLLGLITLIAVGIALVAGRTFIVTPVETLKGVMRRIAVGDFGARTQLAAGIPGLRDLGDAVDDLAVALERRGRERDLAERSLSEVEQRLHFALEASRVGVWEADLTTGRTYWSETCEVMHGLARGTFGRSLDAFSACIHPADREQVLKAIERAARDHADAELEYRTVWSDGSEHRISSTGHFVYDAAGVPIRGAGVAMDVTDRRSLEDQLRQAQKMDAIGQLAGGIAHDFNNMLTAIIGNAEFVLDELPSGDAHRGDIEEVTKAARRAAVLTHQLLAFSRKQILAPRVVKLGAVINEIAPMLRRLLGETIVLETKIGDRGQVMADAGQIEQVIVNLSVNARDAMPDGGRLTIETSDVDLDDVYARHHPSARVGAHVMVAVGDTGHGMDAATQKRIFEPFFTTKPKGQGTGLGLATAYGIATQSGGHLSVRSEPGRGTTFALYLPRVDHAEARPAEAPSARALKGTETILLVEDEDVVREFVSRALTRYGYVVLAAEDGGKALAIGRAHAGAIDLILTDVVLPDMNGRAMADELHQRHDESKILYMSGYTDDAIVRHGVLEADTWFLQKPFTAETIAGKVREVLD